MPPTTRSSCARPTAKASSRNGIQTGRSNQARLVSTRSSCTSPRKAMIALLAATMATAPLMGGINQTPVERLNYAAQHLGSSPGELGYEAKRRNFDYRRHLLQAIEGKRAAVIALCEFTMAEIPPTAARHHGEVLANLLQHFGD